MVWANNRPGRNVPEKVRQKVFRRDNHTCTLNYEGCTIRAEQIDHILNLARGGTDDIDNLTAVCLACHKVKVQQEAMAGRRRHLRTLTPPGLAR